MFAFVLAVAITPGVALLSYFYIRDLYESEPLRTVLFSFVLGILSVYPVRLLQSWLDTGIENSYVHVFVVASGAEEFIKFLILLLFTWKNSEVNEAYDGILYSVAISLGFATIENIVSVLPYGWETAAIRAFLPVPGHALFAVVMGYYVGRSKFEHGTAKFLKIGKALLYAWILHAAYDLILLSEHYLWGVLIVPFMIMLWIVGLRKIKTAQERSPFKPKS